MRVIDAAAVSAALSYPALVDTLEAAFRAGAHAPVRHHHAITLDGRPDATLLLMPAWSASAASPAAAGRYLGIKLVTVFPDNGLRSLPAVQGGYLLASAETGQPLALIDAPSLTTWRTAAASALASRQLSRPDASIMVMAGAGAMAPFLIRAHASVLPLTDVLVWNRTRAAAERVAAVFAGSPLRVRVVDDLEAAVRTADLVSCATLSTTPLIHGGWLKAGAHLDLVGGFRPDMREADDECIRRSSVWVDTRAGATKEAGDIVVPLASGVLAADAVRGDLYELARGTAVRRSSSTEITLFKSVGAAIEDLAAAVAVYEAASS